MKRILSPCHSFYIKAEDIKDLTRYFKNTVEAKRHLFTYLETLDLKSDKEIDNAVFDFICISNNLAD